MTIGSNRFQTLINCATHLSAVAILALIVASGAPRDARAASAAQASAKGGEVTVYATADEASPLIELVRDGAGLTPLGEMTGAGGEKWFMVKTRSGNVGWIKASDNVEARKIDDHFRALPRDPVSFGPSDAGGSSAPAPATIDSATGAITIPVKINGNKVAVPVTFNNGNSSASGYLAVDTGADQTMISKRIARDLRIPSIGAGISSGIGGAARTEIGRVESMTVGKVVVKNVVVTIHDFTNDPRYEGLLGFDFLGRFRMSLDSEKQLMVLTPLNK